MVKTRKYKKHQSKARGLSLRSKSSSKSKTKSLRSFRSLRNEEENVEPRRSSRSLRSQGFRKSKTYRKSSSISPNRYEKIAPKEVRINTPENELFEYYLASSEKDWKQKEKFYGIQKCAKHPKKRSDFPCKMKRTIFNNKKEYEDYEDMKDMRNESTGYKSRVSHYDDIDTILQLKGDELYRINNSS
jgi:hypothetical protein